MAKKKGKTKREILGDAKGLLRKNWVPGDWCIFESGERWTPDDGFDHLLHLVETSREISHTPNPVDPNCQVCAEGAVYLACALAGDETDERAKEIISLLDSATTANSIVELNDGDSEEDGGLEPVVAAFNEVERGLTEAEEALATHV